MSDDRLTAIEIKLSRQEDLVDSLNHTVYLQQKKLDGLTQLCAEIARQLQVASANSETAAAHEPPPHY